MHPLACSLGATLTALLAVGCGRSGMDLNTREPQGGSGGSSGSSCWSCGSGGVVFSGGTAGPSGSGGVTGDSLPSSGGSISSGGSSGQCAGQAPIHHRPSAVQCPSQRAPGPSCANTTCSTCSSDSQCKAGVNGRCFPWEGLVGPGGCSYDECFTDSNCGSKIPCLCVRPPGSRGIAGDWDLISGANSGWPLALPRRSSRPTGRA